MADLTTVPDNISRPSDLTELEARAVEAWVLLGMSKNDAIKYAGYKSRSAGYNALRKEHTRRYAAELIREHLLESSVDAARKMRELSTSARSEYVQLEASRDILDRSGFKPVERHAHLHGGTVSVSIDLGE